VSVLSAASYLPGLELIWHTRNMGLAYSSPKAETLVNKKMVPKRLKFENASNLVCVVICSTVNFWAVVEIFAWKKPTSPGYEDAFTAFSHIAFVSGLTRRDHQAIDSIFGIWIASISQALCSAELTHAAPFTCGNSASPNEHDLNARRRAQH
jgi:hypothetical protein